MSLAIVQALVDGVNRFNERAIQRQAAAERRFVEGRLAVARVELRSAEERLEHFLRTNRDLASSPELVFERDRLPRDVLLQQQLFTSLAQAYEDARIREVRDTPVITITESPSVPIVPMSRGRAKRGLLGLLVGGLLSVLAILVSNEMERRRQLGDPEASEFVRALNEVGRQIAGRVRWIQQRTRHRQ